MSNPATPAVPQPPATMRRKVLVNFGLFALFFFFYLGAALVQTPSFKDLASMETLGMPFGLLVSLAIFPVSWILIVIWFAKAR